MTNVRRICRNARYTKGRFKMTKRYGRYDSPKSFEKIRAMPTIPPSISELGSKKTSIEKAAKNAPMVIHRYIERCCFAVLRNAGIGYLGKPSLFQRFNCSTRGSVQGRPVSLF